MPRIELEPGVGGLVTVAVAELVDALHVQRLRSVQIVAFFEQLDQQDVGIFASPPVVDGAEWTLDGFAILRDRLIGVALHVEQFAPVGPQP